MYMYTGTILWSLQDTCMFVAMFECGKTFVPVEMRIQSRFRCISACIQTSYSQMESMHWLILQSDKIFKSNMHVYLEPTGQ